MNSRVDVIMATYNGERFVGEQIESVMKNEGVNVYLHIFDDGSADRTLEIIREYAGRYPSRIYVEENAQNLRVTKNFLSGIQRVMEHEHEAEYFMCCDQDDVWDPDKISRTLKRMHQMEKRFGTDRPLFVFTDAQVVNESLTELKSSFYKSQHYQVHKTDPAHLLMENKCIGCTTMINRSFAPYLWELPDHARYHDWWLALIAASFGNISFLPRCTLRYRQHSGNVVGSTGFVAYIVNRITGLKKQKESLLENKKQAEEFLAVFHDALSPHKRMLVERFIMMFDQPWYKRRYTAVKYGYVKSGIVRNLGLMLIL